MITLNNVEVNVTMFPDNTSQVWKLENLEEAQNSDSVVIRWDFENEAEIFHLMQLCLLLRNSFDWKSKSTLLLMRYLPYGRQDKHVSNESTFALTMFADLINQCNFDMVTTVDAHSLEFEKLIVNAENIKPRDYIKAAHDCISNFETNAYNTIFAYPDAGAAIRYNPNREINCIIGHKERDQLTGYITRYKIKGSPKGRDVLIIDDICDGGMTFKLMSEELMKQGAQSVHLYVSHGIFSKGIQTLRDSGIKRIFTINGEVK